jgi:hypothetical protein
MRDRIRGRERWNYEITTTKVMGRWEEGGTRFVSCGGHCYGRTPRSPQWRHNECVTASHQHCRARRCVSRTAGPNVCVRRPLQRCHSAYVNVSFILVHRWQHQPATLSNRVPSCESAKKVHEGRGGGLWRFRTPAPISTFVFCTHCYWGYAMVLSSLLMSDE